VSIAFADIPPAGAFAAPPPLSWAASIAAHAVFFALIAFGGEMGPLPALPEPKPLEVTFASPAQPPQIVAKPAKKALPDKSRTQPKPAPGPVLPSPERQALAKMATVTNLPDVSPIPEVAPRVMSTPSTTTVPAAPIVSAPTPAPTQAVVVAKIADIATPIPAASAKPTSEESASAATAASQARWHELLAKRLREMKRYPMAARRLGQEGVVVIGLQMTGDAGVADIGIRQGSDYPLLDQAALRLVREAVAALQDQHPGHATRLDIPIAYRLREG